jgi:hypothetical protein
MPRSICINERPPHPQNKGLLVIKVKKGFYIITNSQHKRQSERFSDSYIC